MPVKAPFSPQNFYQETFAATTGFPVHPVIGTHDGFHAAFFHGRLEGGKVCFTQILFRHPRVKAVAQVFRTGVHGKVFHARGGF